MLKRNHWVVYNKSFALGDDYKKQLISIPM